MSPAQQLILAVLNSCGSWVHRTKLVKLVYLIDYVYYQHYGRTLTGLTYEWDQFGPNAVGNAIVREAEKLTEKGSVALTVGESMYGGPNYRYRIADAAEIPDFPPQEAVVIRDVLARYGGLSVSDIVRKSKQTKPFKEASQFQVLEMTQGRPAAYTTSEDLAAFQKDLEEHGTESLDEIKRKYQIA